MEKRRGHGRREPDYVLILVVAALVLLGLLMVYSTTFDWGYAEGNPFRFVERQAMWLALGIGLAVVLARTDYTIWQRWAVPMLALTLVVLALLLVVGDLLLGARRALFHGSVQPGELAKLVTVIYAAAWVSSKGEQIRDMTYGLIPFAVWIGMVAALVVAQPDMSAAVILVLSGSAVFFLAGADLGQLFVAGVTGSAEFCWVIMLYPYAR